MRNFKYTLSFRTYARSSVGIKELKAKDEPASGRSGRQETPRLRSG